MCVGDGSLFLSLFLRRRPDHSSSLILCRRPAYETFRPYFFFERYQTILISFNIKKIINIKNNYIDINDISIKKKKLLILDGLAQIVHNQFWTIFPNRLELRTVWPKLSIIRISDPLCWTV
jgi:hypothetical protein